MTPLSHLWHYYILLFFQLWFLLWLQGLLFFLLFFLLWHIIFIIFPIFSHWQWERGDRNPWPMHKGMPDKWLWWTWRPVHLDQLEGTHTEWNGVNLLLYTWFSLLTEIAVAVNMPYALQIYVKQFYVQQAIAVWTTLQGPNCSVSVLIFFIILLLV